MSEKEYLTVAVALELVLAEMTPLPAERVPLPAALGRILAEPIVAADDMPPFANSAMDGYALRAGDSQPAHPDRPVTLQVVADIAAGTVSDIVLRAGSAARIMTGAPLPAGADAVIPVEDTNEAWRGTDRPLPAQIDIFRAVGAGDYVRHAGEDVAAGTQVLSPGHYLRPQALGLLASLGVAMVPVIRRPRVGILATGDELIAVEAPLTPGKIRNSNGYTQAAQVEALGAVPVNLGIGRDSEADVAERLAQGLAAGVDLFISSAGVSVGAYDVVKTVLEKAGNVGFWRVRMRPGKPLAFGRYGGVPYLGLPGNPVSAMVSFERFARPAILKLAGHTNLARPLIDVVLGEAITSDGRESYLRATVSRERGGYSALTTGGQGSHMMTSLVRANALLIVPEGVRALPAGAVCQAMMIDWPNDVF